MKYAILHPAALLLPLALLTGCARTPDMTPVWQETLPGQRRQSHAVQLHLAGRKGSRLYL